MTILLSSLRSANYYDSASLEDLANYQELRLMGNANVGNLVMTNLQVAGMTTFEGSFIVTHWYARTDIPRRPGRGDTNELLDLWSNSAVVTFQVGDRNVWTSSLYDLLRMWRWSPQDPTPNAMWPRAMWPEIIRERMNVSMRISTFGRALDALRLQCSGFRQGEYPPRVWLHLEGVTVPPGQAESALELLIDQGHQRRTAEDRIAEWIIGTAKDNPGPGAEAQAYALADGILEGRHR